MGSMSSRGKTIAVVGAGITGRMVAWHCAQAGMQVALFEARPPEDLNTCSFVGAGMLAPYSESALADPALFSLGQSSLSLWEGLFPLLGLQGAFYDTCGTLILSHSQDKAELTRFKSRLPELKIGEGVTVNAHQIRDMEPNVEENFSEGIYFSKEAQIHGPHVLYALGEWLEALGVFIQYQSKVTEIASGGCKVNGKTRHFDTVIDCRGVDGEPDWPELRSVRGELIWVKCPDVQLNHLIRLCHPRYGLYIAPRPNHEFLVGATSIESKDDSPISVRSVLELLSGLYSLNPAFGEARVIRSATGCRPAFFDNLPRIQVKDGGGLIRVNGLYRHGFLLSPLLAQAVVGYLKGEREGTGLLVPELFEQSMTEVKHDFH